jgi:nucleotide-binding universal stress UspA family protein
VTVYAIIVCAIDGSPDAGAALAEARRLVDPDGGHIVALYCDQRLDGRPGGWAHAMPRDVDLHDVIAEQVEALRLQGVPVELRIERTHGEAADAAARVAEEVEADVVVCGTRGRSSLAGVLLGSFTHRLLQISPCPVLAVRADMAHVGEATPA